MSAEPPDSFADAAPESSRAPRRPDTGDPTTLLLVRHGRTAHTEQRRVSGGGGSDPELSLAGMDDAGRAAAALARIGEPTGLLPGLPRPAALVMSPMRRTRQTAAAIAQALDLAPSLAPDWIEVGFGAWDGLTYGEIAQKWPAELAAWQGSGSAAPPGEGESLNDLAERIRQARLNLASAYAGRVVVVVTHVTPIRAVVRDVLDAGVAAMWRVRIGPCSITAARFWDDGGAELAMVNAAAAA